MGKPGFQFQPHHLKAVPSQISYFKFSELQVFMYNQTKKYLSWFLVKIKWTVYKVLNTLMHGIMLIIISYFLVIYCKYLLLQDNLWLSIVGIMLIIISYFLVIYCGKISIVAKKSKHAVMVMVLWGRNLTRTQKTACLCP